MDDNKMATIKDVAKQAQVSTATVSRVLNDNYPVSIEAKEKVLQAMKELNYEPNAVARSLKNNKTFMIGIIVPDISNPYFMGIARGIESIVADLGYSLIFGSSDEDEKKELRLLKGLKERRVDCVVLATRQTRTKKLKEFIEQGLNIVMVDTKLSGLLVDVVVEDDYHAAFRLINHVIDQGHKKIGIVNGLMTVNTAVDRFEGFKQALYDHKIECREQYIVNGNFNRDVAYQAVKQMLQKNHANLPTALFSVNNYMTEGTIIAIKEYGLQIPRDISVVSFGELSVPKLTEPRLTIVSQNAFEMGKKAGEIVLNKIDREPEVQEYKEYIMKSELIIRDSVKKLK